MSLFDEVNAIIKPDNEIMKEQYDMGVAKGKEMFEKVKKKILTMAQKGDYNREFFTKRRYVKFYLTSHFYVLDCLSKYNKYCSDIAYQTFISLCYQENINLNRRHWDEENGFCMNVMFYIE